MYLDESSGVFADLLDGHMGFDRRRKQLADGSGKLLEELAREFVTVDVRHTGEGPDAFLHRVSRTQPIRVLLSFQVRDE